MKKAAVIVLFLIFTVNMTAFAGGAPKGQCSTEHRPASKNINKGSFQGAADHVSCWGKSAVSARQQSLRGNREALKKRNAARKM